MHPAHGQRLHKGIQAPAPKEGLETFQSFPISPTQNLRQILDLLSVETSRVRILAGWVEKSPKSSKPPPVADSSLPLDDFAPNLQTLEHNPIQQMYRL